MTPALALLQQSLAAAEPQPHGADSEQQWRRFCVALVSVFPQRFKITKREDSVDLDDVKSIISVRRYSDGVELYAAGHVTISCGCSLLYTDPKLMQSTTAFVKLQEQCTALYDAAAAAAAPHNTEITTLLAQIQDRGGKVKQAVAAFRRRVNKGFRESGFYDKENLL